MLFLIDGYNKVVQLCGELMNQRCGDLSITDYLYIINSPSLVLPSLMKICYNYEQARETPILYAALGQNYIQSSLFYIGIIIPLSYDLSTFPNPYGMHNLSHFFRRHGLLSFVDNSTICPGATL
ncbi:hypothetical protein DVH24_019437 [Malus domestica]|uniref:Uncharacterized protein n=1 Tax=Malus domestica TaxID=3750 RepID=A0A498I0X9_MALDO|nr:hypothetical protein DVH24_019437 [Malus domestica]